MITLPPIIDFKSCKQLLMNSNFIQLGPKKSNAIQEIGFVWPTFSARSSKHYTISRIYCSINHAMIDQYNWYDCDSRLQWVDLIFWRGWNHLETEISAELLSHYIQQCEKQWVDLKFDNLLRYLVFWWYTISLSGWAVLLKTIIFCFPMLYVSIDL